MPNEIYSSPFTIDRSHGDGNFGIMFPNSGKYGRNAGNIWPTHPPDKSARRINQKPQNCRFVHIEEIGQKWGEE